MNLQMEGCRNENTAAIKARLNALGYDCGEGNAFDRRTVWAVRWFCRQNDLPLRGDVDDELWAAMSSETAVRGVTGAFQYYSMKDPMWAEYPYDAANTPEVEVISNSACGPTSMAMALSTALKRAVLPPVLADWANARGFRDPDGIEGTDDTFFPACAELYGMTAEVRPMPDEAAFECIRAEIAAGNAIICNVAAGSPFTRCGHYNLISEISDGKVHICDPVPKNMELPDYPISQWLKEKYGKTYTVVAPKK